MAAGFARLPVIFPSCNRNSEQLWLQFFFAAGGRFSPSFVVQPAIGKRSPSAAVDVLLASHLCCGLVSTVTLVGQTSMRWKVYSASITQTSGASLYPNSSSWLSKASMKKYYWQATTSLTADGSLSSDKNSFVS